MKKVPAASLNKQPGYINLLLSYLNIQKFLFILVSMDKSLCVLNKGQQNLMTKKYLHGVYIS